MEYIQMGALGSVLALQSYHDLRKKEIPVLITIAGAAIGLLLGIVEDSLSLNKFISLVPGLLCLVFAKISREAMGYGDGFLICMMGIYLEINKLISVCMCAFILAAVVALFLLAFGKKKGKQEMAFVPFLLLAFLMEGFICEMA